MDEKIKVSVIMGVYNSNIEYLKNAIISISNQTYKNLEFIICDDCSTNSDISILLHSITELDKRIKIISTKKNSGLSVALNECLSVAKGEYIARMDDDDYSHLDRIEKQVNFLENNSEYGVLGCGINLIDKNGVWGTMCSKENPEKKDFLFSTPFVHPTIMVRKEVYEMVSGYSCDRWTKRTEDYDLFMRIYACGVKGHNIREVLYDYRMDFEGYKKQKFRYRINEVVIKYRGFKKLGLFPAGYIYLLKPILSGLIPNRIKQIVNKNRFSKMKK